MNDIRWNDVRQFYMDSFGISPDLVDIMASNEVLLMSVSGSSNKSISNILDIEEDTIKEIIHTVFDFDGWEVDLSFSPYKIYESDSDYISFVGSVLDTKDTTDLIDITLIDLMYKNCMLYSDIEQKLDIQWI